MANWESQTPLEKNLAFMEQQELEMAKEKENNRRANFSPSALFKVEIGDSLPARGGVKG